MAAGAEPVLDLQSEFTPLRTLARDVWRHRALLPLLGRQVFHSRYRAARLGILWSIIQPLARGALLAVVFTYFVEIPVEGMPYPAFVLAGTTAWGFLSNSVTGGTNGIVGSGGLARQLYFPRIVLPSLDAASRFPGYVVTMVIVIGLSALFGEYPSVRLFLLPVAMLLGFLLVSGMSSLLALLFVYFRDIGPIVNSSVGMLFFLTPIIYPVDSAGSASWLLSINPFTGALEAIRWCLFSQLGFPTVPVLSTVAWTVSLGGTALLAFRHHERTCVDRL